jgi:DNA-binding transcriptional MerR regulator
MGATTTGWSVGEVAAFASVTVRTLHHYDEVGLLSPNNRTAAGYRVYGEQDLDRLQQILAYRGLGFSLESIKELLDDSTVGRVHHLRRQHELLAARVRRLEQMLATLERTMEAHEMGIRLTPQEMLEVFGEHDPTEHAAEAQDRWGDTDAYRESHRRTSSYTKDDWVRIKAEAAAVERRLAEAFEAGEPAGGATATDAAEAHRQHIRRWFYECTHEIHCGLAEMYVADPRFTAHYEQVAPGLAAYVHDAIVANASRG